MVGEGACSRARIPGNVKVDPEHRQSRQAPVGCDDFQALGDRVSEQRCDSKISLQRRAHGLHVAHLAHRLPVATCLPQRRDRDRSEYTGLRPERYR
jgi:hypothetical protein